MSFIQCMANNQFTNEPTKWTKLSLKCLHYVTIQRVPTCCNPHGVHHQGTGIKQYCIKHNWLLYMLLTYSVYSHKAKVNTFCVWTAPVTHVKELSAFYYLVPQHYAEHVNSKHKSWLYFTQYSLICVPWWCLHGLKHVETSCIALQHKRLRQSFVHFVGWYVNRVWTNICKKC